MKKTIDNRKQKDTPIRPVRCRPNYRRLAGLAELKKFTYLINGIQRIGRIYDERLFEISMRYLTSREKRQILNMVIEKGKKLGYDIRRMALEMKNAGESIDSALQHFHRNDRLKNTIYEKILNALVNLRDHVSRRKRKGDVQLEQKLREISSIFDLNEVDQEVLLLLFLASNDGVVERLYNETVEITDSKMSGYSSAKSKKPIAILTGLSKHDVDVTVSEKSTLLRTGILDNDGELTSEVIDFLSGSGTKPLSSRYFTEYTGDVLRLKEHSIEKKHIETVVMLRQNKAPGRGVNILLYGEPGAGKTSFSRSLAKNLGLRAYEISNLSDEKSERIDQNLFRYRAFLACQKMTDPERSVIIVDEADMLLNSLPNFFHFGNFSDKGQTNRLLDESTSFTIWISNRYDNIADSTRRRFDYSIKFEKMTFNQRKRVWQHCIAKHGLSGYLSGREIESLASDFETTPAGIESAVRNASQIHSQNASKIDVRRTIDTLLQAHMTILDPENTCSSTKKPNAPRYSLDGLNIKGDVEETLEIIDSFNTYWFASGSDKAIRNLNILLYGAPGTGKSEFVKYVARRTNRRLMTKRASDLLCMWVGETEKCTRKIFEQAERESAILFLDEVDSLLWNRESARHSWEVSQVNELLTSMESFTGLLICATNFKQILDNASFRRFDFKLKFDYLKPDGNEIFYGLFLKNLVEAPLTPQEMEQIRKLQCLAPGDFKAVYQRHYFIDKNQLSHQMLIEALVEELKIKNSNYGKTMGFTPSTHPAMDATKISGKKPDILPAIRHCPDRNSHGVTSPENTTLNKGGHYETIRNMQHQ